jgi:WD40 repeat protein
MRHLTAIFAAAVTAAAAQAQELPDPRPILRIEPGVHTAKINRIGVDAACKLMLTGSDDKTVRLWALPASGGTEPELLRTLRVPIGGIHNGAVHTVDLSPDGKWAAAGGFDVGYQGKGQGTTGIYIFEAATGRLVTRLGGLGAAAGHLAFSPDGTRLAATFGVGRGVRIWDTGNWQLIAEDRDYGGEDSYGAVFSRDNTLYTVSDDGRVRRYGPDGRLEAKASTHGGRQPFSIAVQPHGFKLAIGFADTSAVEVYDARALRPLYAAETGGANAVNLGSVAWSAHGDILYAAGSQRTGSVSFLSFWLHEGHGRRRDAPLAHNTIMELLPCRNGIAAATADPAFGVVAEDGTKLTWLKSVTADMRGKIRGNFLISGDGSRVRFGLTEGGDWPVDFDVRTLSASDRGGDMGGLFPRNKYGLEIYDWEDTTSPTLYGHFLPLEPGETSRSYAVAPDASAFVLGADYFLRAFSARGRLLWKNFIPGEAYGVNISRNGKLVVAAYADGTIRWHRLSDGQELLALFVHKKDLRFVAWTPKGYYAASPGGEELIGWHVNRGFDSAPDFLPASAFREQFNRPDIVRLVLDVLDEDGAIAEANRRAGR